MAYGDLNLTMEEIQERLNDVPNKIGEAPKDNSFYGRVDGNWSKITATYITQALGYTPIKTLSIEADVTNTTGIPSVVIGKSGTNNAPIYSFTFKNIKGKNGNNGQGINYQWNGTRLRLGTIDSNGNTTWGSYVDLQGEKGNTGTLQANSTCIIPKNGVLFKSDQNIGIKLSGGNGIYGWHEQAGIGNLYISYGIGANYHTKIYNLESLTSSDIRLKNVIKDATILDKIEQLRAFYFTYKNDAEEKSKVHLGVSAQDVQKVFPELVQQNTPIEGDSYLSVDYISLATVVAICGTKELFESIKIMQSEIQRLKKTLTKEVC